MAAVDRVNGDPDFDWGLLWNEIFQGNALSAKKMVWGKFS